MSPRSFDLRHPTNNTQCCFCGKTIAPEDSGVSIVIPVDSEGTQELFCHASCLKPRLHPSVPTAF